ncbi:MAG: Lrp/AsnC ligand binding domain-containing protein [Candidatus Bathyarchaeota archaeon]|nr:MAG: Lrp/AsnC ligand binding domain-containing protein [Candidatus Bathyarchaeota archaeon]
MISAYTLVRTAPEKNLQVFKEVQKLPMIKESTLVYGEYDIIIKTKTKSIKELNKFTYSVLRRIPHVVMTTTMIVANIPNKG